jgi:hypothetical protein
LAVEPGAIGGRPICAVLSWDRGGHGWKEAALSISQWVDHRSRFQQDANQVTALVVV